MLKTVTFLVFILSLVSCSSGGPKKSVQKWGTPQEFDQNSAFKALESHGTRNTGEMYYSHEKVIYLADFIAKEDVTIQGRAIKKGQKVYGVRVSGDGRIRQSPKDLKKDFYLVAPFLEGDYYVSHSESFLGKPVGSEFYYIFNLDTGESRKTQLKELSHYLNVFDDSHKKNRWTFFKDEQSGYVPVVQGRVKSSIPNVDTERHSVIGIDIPAITPFFPYRKDANGERPDYEKTAFMVRQNINGKRGYQLFDVDANPIPGESYALDEILPLYTSKSFVAWESLKNGSNGYGFLKVLDKKKKLFWPITTEGLATKDENVLGVFFDIDMDKPVPSMDPKKDGTFPEQVWRTAQVLRKSNGQQYWTLHMEERYPTKNFLSNLKDEPAMRWKTVTPQGYETEFIRSIRYRSGFIVEPLNGTQKLYYIELTGANEHKHPLKAMGVDENGVDSGDQVLAAIRKVNAKASKDVSRAKAAEKSWSEFQEKRIKEQEAEQAATKTQRKESGSSSSSAAAPNNAVRDQIRTSTKNSNLKTQQLQKATRQIHKRTGKGYKSK